MQTPDTHATALIAHFRLRVVLALSLVLAGLQVSAQQQTQSGAVEELEAVFDVGVAMRPRAGLFGITELMIASLEADIPAAAQLLGAGADINETDDSQSTALMWAVHSGDVRIVQFLIDNDADVHAKAFQGATALINAISGQQEASAIALLNAGADPNGRGNNRRNFLEAAAESGMTAVVDALIKNNVELSEHGASALAYAVARRHIGPVQSLLDAGVDANANTDMYGTSGRSILFAAAKSRDIDIVNLLISRGADAGRGTDYQSPLYPAASAGSGDLVQILLESGAVATPNHLVTAVRGKNIEAAYVILRFLDINSLDQSYVESLLKAADGQGDEEFMHVLLNAAAAPRVNDEHVVLFYSPKNDDNCSVWVWDPATTTETKIYEENGECDGKFFVADGGGILFALLDDEIRTISLHGTASDATVKYPVEQINQQMLALAATFNENMDGRYGNLDSNNATVTEIGLLDGGYLGLATLTYGPADGQFMKLFGHFNGEWQFVSEQACGRMDSGCAFAQLNGRRVLDWPQQRRAWNPSIRKNPYFRGKESDVSRFEFHGQEVLLRYSTDTYGHCGGDCTYASHLELVIPPQNNEVLSEGQSHHSIFQNFILVSSTTRSADGQRGVTIDLIDMVTGERVLSALQLATWVE